MNLESINTPSDLMKANDETIDIKDYAPSQNQMDQILHNVMKEHGPVAIKYILMEANDFLFRAHVIMAESELEEGNKESSDAWMRDAGKFQAVSNIISTVDL